VERLGTISIMVDIHCHILPGLDDGPATLAESVEMAKMAMADGITHVVATPHASDRFKFEPELIRSRRDELQEMVGEKLQLATGCDFHMNVENLRAFRAEPARFTIHQKNYLLVEFADFAIPAMLDDVMKEMLVSGITPIITHPERNPLLRSRPERLQGWVAQGCFVQLTAGSLLGRFGQSAQIAAEKWLGEGLIHFVATDAHNAKTRPLQLKEAYQMVARKHDKPLAEALFRENPLAAFEGRPLPYVPAPKENEPAEPQKKRFLFF